MKNSNLKVHIVLDRPVWVCSVTNQMNCHKQVAELYELVKKWDAMADTLPHIVDRLSALKDLHEQGKSSIL